MASISPQQIHNNCSVAWHTGILLFTPIVISYIISVVGFFVGITINALTFPAAVLASWIVTAFSHGLLRDKLASIGLSLAIIVVSIIIATFIEDPSFDGNTYHQEAIISMMEGWNPVRDNSDVDLSIWAKHYAKGFETLSACIGAVSGRVESGKAVNLLLIIATGLLLYAFLRRRGYIVSQKWALIVTLFFISNPVGICQMPTFYIDFTKYYLLLLTAIGCIGITGNKSFKLQCEYCTIVSGCIILAISIKFNIFFDEGLMIIAFLCWHLYHKDTNNLKRLFILGLIATITSVALSYHPYITNILSHGNPFYPLLGEEAVDIMSFNTPQVYLGHNRFVNFLISYCSPSLPGIDKRINGFGFPFTLLLAISIYALIRYRREMLSWVWYSLVWIVASCFVFEQSWWARYCCQLWAMPCLTAFAVVRYTDGRSSWLKKSYIFFYCLSSALCIASAIYSVTKTTYLRYYIYMVGYTRPLHVQDLTIPAARHFNERSIEFIPIDNTRQGIFYYSDKNLNTVIFPTIEMDSTEIETFKQSFIARKLQLEKFCVN